MMRDWLKLAGREGAEKVGRADRLWRVRRNIMDYGEYERRLWRVQNKIMEGTKEDYGG